MKKVLFSVLVFGVITFGVFVSTPDSPATVVADGTDYSETNGFPIQPPV
ncbi:hypothetical protein [Pseudoneobacillus rhizosphaerae]|jgi:hypothetical protein|uniref:Phr family secreted Rap phosphatase inhibitor n=1 Tax=Pseudoneobacillus rhizosphaerae TaxID=2880968 RepID=A0A9C7LAP6_9BACI|nr:hypothetical protein [Pseudoneobacillus rhizosphaerae]CAG9608687.1 hypothetical protein NEOCIP111885_02404 [Pseudoneobacillus rhizosphaerae]